jgi:hypothetical protein
MTHFFKPAAPYIVLFVGWACAGLFMLVSPIRFGNLLHGCFEFFPEVKQSDYTWKLTFRVLGAATLGFASHLVWVVTDLVRGG